MFWAPIKPSSLQPHRTTTTRLYECWVHHESWKSTGEVSSIGVVFAWKRCRHICPMCWFLHSIALEIEPSPNPLFCNVKFNPIEDQSTVLFRIIKIFTTKSVNLRFLLIFIFYRGVLIIIIHVNVNHRVEMGHKPKTTLSSSTHVLCIPQPRFPWHHGWKPPLAMIIILDVTGVNWHC